MRFISWVSNSFFTFLIIDVAAVTQSADNMYYAMGVLAAFSSGFGLRMMSDIRKSKFSFQNSAIQFFTAIFLCYVAYRLQKDWTPGVKIENYIFISALFSNYIADMGMEIVELGIFKYVEALKRKIALFFTSDSGKIKDQGGKEL